CNPQWLLSRVNSRLAMDMEDSRFVTAFAGCVGADGALNWWSAGHGPIFVRRCPTDPVEMLSPQCPPIGVDPEMPLENPASVQLGPGGQVIILSDGIFEAPHHANRELFGIDRVIKIFDRCVQRDAAELLACIRDEVSRWQGREEPADDQTVVIVRRVG